MSKPGKPRGLETDAVHGGSEGPRWQHSLLPPIAQTSTFVFDSVAALIAHKEGRGDRHPEYGRYANPTVTAVEAKLAALEGAEDALICASGMAAITLIALTVLGRDAHVLLTADVYPGTRAMLQRLLPRFGVAVDVVPVNDWAAFDAAVRPSTGFVFTELPSNPHLYIPDLEALSARARKHRFLTVVDATLASPALCRPLEHGADLVVHSATKYLGGHNDILAGAIAGKRAMIDALRETNGLIGAVIGPHDAFLLDRGLKTLPLRMAQHSASGAQLAARLAADPRVEAVFYPGAGDATNAALAARYLPHGRGGLLSFRPKGGPEAAARVLDALRLIRHAGSLGGTESLAQITYLFALHGMAPAEAASWPIEPDLIRLSVGLEAVEDLWADLDQALTHASG